MGQQVLIASYSPILFDKRLLLLQTLEKDTLHKIRQHTASISSVRKKVSDDVVYLDMSRKNSVEAYRP